MTTTSEARVYASSGTLHVAPRGTTMPTTTSAALDAAFKDCGETSADGLEVGFDSTTEVLERKWNGEAYLIGSKETTITFKLTLLDEMNDVAAKLFTGATPSGASIVYGKPDTTPQALVYTTIADDNSIKRILVPAGVVTEREPLMHKNDEATKYTITVTALYDETAGYCAKALHDVDFAS